MIAVLAITLLCQRPAPPPEVKDRASLLADIDAGRFLNGTYQIDRPVVLNNARPTAIGNPMRRATIIATGGSAFIAGWAESKPPPELWTADGGIRLRDAKGQPWRIAFPFGSYSHPGRFPSSWSGLTKAEWTIDFRLAAYATSKGEGYPLFACAQESVGPAPITVAAQGSTLIVTIRDSVGLKTLRAPVLNGSPGARNVVTITATADALTATGSKGKKSIAIQGPLADNITGVFQINSHSPYATYGDPMMGPGDLTLYGFRFAAEWPRVNPFPWKSDVALKLPAKGQWSCPPGGFLIRSSDVPASWPQGPIVIRDLDIRSSGMTDGASIMLGGTQAGVTIDRVTTSGHNVGIGSLSRTYAVRVHGGRGSFHKVAAMHLRDCIMHARDYDLNRNLTDNIVVRGGQFTLDGGFMAPAGDGTPGTNRRSSFRILPTADQTFFRVSNYLLDDEGTEPTEAHIVAEASETSPENWTRITFRDCSFQGGSRIAKLSGAGKGGLPSLTLDNVVSMTKTPTVDASEGWRVTGVPIGLSGNEATPAAKPAK